MRLFRATPAEALLRIAIAFAFLYPAIDAVFDPNSWLGYFPNSIVALYDHIIGTPLRLSDLFLLHTFGLLEVILALWLLFGRRVRTPALIMALLLFLIVVTHLDSGDFSVLFRDISIAFAAIALAAYDSKRTR